MGCVGGRLEVPHDGLSYLRLVCFLGALWFLMASNTHDFFFFFFLIPGGGLYYGGCGSLGFVVDVCSYV